MNCLRFSGRKTAQSCHFRANQNLEEMRCLSLQGMKILIYGLNLTKNKPILLAFYNSQPCGVDLFNEMLKDYSSQPVVSNNWTMVVYTFILNKSVINAQTVLKYSSEPRKDMFRRQFFGNLRHQLCMPHKRKRLH